MDGLTSFFILIILFVLCLSLVWAGFKYVVVREHIRFYKQLFESVTPETLAKSRRDILQEAKKHPEYGSLWQSFDATLVIQLLPNRGQRLCRTLDAAEIFNADTLSHGLSGNRILTAVPAFLTAIGVIGTFWGLMEGLEGLKLNQEGTTALNQGIREMISGASMAFTTSVWGVISSLIFNVCEKLMEYVVLRHILQIQNQIDFLFPRFSQDECLARIAESNCASQDVLQGLAEQIGNRFQESLKDTVLSMQSVISQTTTDICSGIEHSMNTIMSPAIDSLVANAKLGTQETQKVLDSLLNRFLCKFGDAGNTQKEIMESVSKEMNNSIKNMAEQINKFINTMSEQIDNMKKESKLRQESQEHHQSLLIKQFNDIISGIVTKLNEHQKQAISQDQARNTAFAQQLRAFIAILEKQSNAIRADADKRQEALADDLLRRDQYQQKQQAQLFEQFNTIVSGLVENFNIYHQQSMEQDKERNAAFNKQMHEIVCKSNGIIESFETQMMQRMQDEKKLHDQIYQDLNSSVTTFESIQKKLVSKVDNIITLQEEQSGKTNTKLAELLERFHDVAEATSTVGREILESSRQMQDCSNRLYQMSVVFQTATDKVSKDIGKAAELTSNVSSQNHETSENFHKSLEGYKNLTADMGKVANHLESATEKAKDGFASVEQCGKSIKQNVEYLDSRVQETLKSFIDKLGEQVSKLLEGYAHQVQTQTTERLNEWNEQTSAYTRSMIEAIKTLNAVVDEIEGKLGRKA